MSRLQSARRRLSLLAGSSLVAASLTGAVAILSVPTAALAANECGAIDPSANADFVVCPASPPNYNSGITYTTAGPFTLSTGGAVNAGTGGIAVTNGNAADTITVNTTAGALTHSGGVGVNASSTGSGTINVSTGAITTSGTGTGGIRAASTGGGAIIVTTSGTITANPSGTSTFLPSYGNAIEATSSGGNGAVSVTVGGNVSGRLRGVLAQSSGTGAVNVTINSGNVVLGANGAGVAVVEANSGGAATINLNGGDLQNQRLGDTILANAGTTLAINVTGANIRNTNGSAIRSTSGGNTTITVAAGRSISGFADAMAALDITTGSSATATINNNGNINTAAALADRDDVVIRASGGRVVVNNAGRLFGAVDFSGVTFVGAQPSVNLSITGGADTTNPSSNTAFGWYTDGLSEFSGGDDLLTTSASGGILVASAATDDATATFDFGAGIDTFANGGLLSIGPRGSDSGEQATGYTFTIINLETFNNSGLIRMGQRLERTDQSPVALLVAEGVTFNGQADSRIELDVAPSAGSQLHCDYTSALDLPGVADCLNLTDGTTTGETSLVVGFTSVPGTVAAGHFNPDGIVLVDVNGAGSSAAGHFILDPQSEAYAMSEALGRGVLNTQGAFFYDLVYDPVGQRHILVGAPKAETLQFATIAHSVQSIWRAGTGSWFDRQADLRGLYAEGGYEGGVWLRAGGEFADRDLTQSFEAANSTWTFDATHNQNIFTLTGGADVAADVAGGSAVFGFMAGYVASAVEFDASPTSVDYRGGTLGAYAGFVSGPLYVDGMLNGTVVLMDQEPVGMELPAGTLTTETLQAYGAQVEVGYRLPVGAGFWVEPLAGASFVRSDINGFELPGSRIAFQNSNSRRLGAGVRVGADGDYEGFRAAFALTAKAWNEFDGESEFADDNDGPDFVFVDTFDGTFGEIGLGFTLMDASGTLGGFLDGGMKFADGYTSTNASAGVRFRW